MSRFPGPRRRHLVSRMRSPSADASTASWMVAKSPHPSGVTTYVVAAGGHWDGESDQDCPNPVRMASPFCDVKERFGTANDCITIERCARRGTAAVGQAH